MVVEIGNHLLDNDAEARRFILGQPLCLGKFARGVGSQGDRRSALQDRCHAAWIGFACSHRIGYGTSPKWLGGGYASQATNQLIYCSPRRRSRRGGERTGTD